MADANLPVDFSRQKLAEFIHKLTRHVMSTCEDDTKSLLALVSVSQSLRAVYYNYADYTCTRVVYTVLDYGCCIFQISKILLINFGTNKQDFEGRYCYFIYNFIKKPLYCTRHQGYNQIKLTMTNNVSRIKLMIDLSVTIDTCS